MYCSAAFFDASNQLRVYPRNCRMFSERTQLDNVTSPPAEEAGMVFGITKFH